MSTTIGAEGLLYKNADNIFVADDAKESADSVIRILEDYSFREQIANNARRHVEVNYNVNKIAEELDEFYHRLLN